MLNELSSVARSKGLSDTDWAARADVRKETLSRLRRRDTCDFTTLSALAAAVDLRIGVLGATMPAATADGHMPVSVDRACEERLVELCASRSLSAERWASHGPRFFMAGLAVMLASTSGVDRRALLGLAEVLHPGASEPAAFNRWLERSPVRPSRFLPLLKMRLRHAA